MCVYLTGALLNFTDDLTETLVDKRAANPTQFSGDIKDIKNNKEFSTQFSNLLSKVIPILDANCLEKLELCKYHCSTLKISDYSDESLFNDEQLTKIDGCKSFNELFRKLRGHLGWLEYSILVSIIDICESEEAEKELKTYQEFIASKMAMNIVSEIIPSDQLPANIIKLYTVLEKPYRHLTLRQYQDLKEYIFKTLNVKKYISLPYIRFFFDSLHIEWYVPVQAATHLIRMAQKNEENLIQNSVIILKINEHVVLDVTNNQVSV